MLILREHGTRLAIRRVREYVVRWGYTQLKTARRAYERDDGTVKDLLSIEYPRIKARPGREHAEISWGDKTEVRSDGSLHRGYVPRIPMRIAKISARRRSLSMIAVVTKQGKVRFIICSGRFEWLIVVRRRLLKGTPRKVFIILGNLNVYEAKTAREWIEEYVDQLEVFYLPP